MSIDRRDDAPEDLQDHRDRRTVERIQAGDAAAFAELFDRYGAQALGLAARMIGSRSVAEEVVQEVFTSVWRRADAYDPTRASVRAWLLMKVHSRAVDTIRHEDALRRRTSSFVQMPAPQADPDDVVEDAWLGHRRRQVRAALEHLTGEQREVLELAYFSGLTQTQVADKTGLPLGTVKSRTLAAMRKLRSLLDDGGSR